MTMANVYLLPTKGKANRHAKNGHAIRSIGTGRDHMGRDALHIETYFGERLVIPHYVLCSRCDFPELGTDWRLAVPEGTTVEALAAETYNDWLSAIRAERETEGK